MKRFKQSWVSIFWKLNILDISKIFKADIGGIFIKYFLILKQFNIKRERGKKIL